MPISSRRLDCCRGFVTRPRTGWTCGSWCPGSSDLPLVRNLSRIGYRDLLRSGVRIYEWDGPMLHAKTIVADGRWVRVGSSNLNPSSLIGNYELDVLVEDPVLGEAMERQFRLDIARSREVTRRPVRGPRRISQALPTALDHREPDVADARYRRPRREVGRRAALALRTIAANARRSVFLPLAAMFVSLGRAVLRPAERHGPRVRGDLRVAGDRGGAGGVPAAGGPLTLLVVRRPTPQAPRIARAVPESGSAAGPSGCGPRSNRSGAGPDSAGPACPPLAGPARCPPGPAAHQSGRDSRRADRAARSAGGDWAGDGRPCRGPETQDAGIATSTGRARRRRRLRRWPRAAGRAPPAGADGAVPRSWLAPGRERIGLVARDEGGQDRVSRDSGRSPGPRRRSRVPPRRPPKLETGDPKSTRPLTRTAASPAAAASGAQRAATSHHAGAVARAASRRTALMIAVSSREASCCRSGGTDSRPSSAAASGQGPGPDPTRRHPSSSASWKGASRSRSARRP